MKISLPQLARHLDRGPLAPVYLVFGDEPLQIGEALDSIRRAASAQGLDERIVFDVGAGFDWSSLPAEAGSLSLFGGGRLLEVNLPTGKPGTEGARVIKSMIIQAMEGVVLLIRCGKLERASQKSAWMTALEKAGVVVRVYSPKPGDLPAWVRVRARDAGLTISEQAGELLAEKSEGNLLACAQELEKLALLFPGQKVGVDELLQSLFDNARYDVFGLVDSALAGDSRRTLHILASLQAEGTAPTLVIWVLARELRPLLVAARQVADGRSAAEAVAASRGVWGHRKGYMTAALQRHTEASLMALLRYLGRIDRVVKGQFPERRTWDELQRLSLRLAGVRA